MPGDTLTQLAALLDMHVPAKKLDRNLLVASWRWEMFDAIDHKAAALPAGPRRRDLLAAQCLAQTLRRFDVTAIQGLIGEAAGMRTVMDLLGHHWALTISGLSPNSTYKERMAFVFDTRKVVPRGLSGQVVLAEGAEKRSDGRPFLARQFFRPPMFCGFRCLDRDFTLANIHVVYGEVGERVAETRAFTRWLREFSTMGYLWERNVIALGQVQLMHSRTPLYQAFESAGLHIPADLVDVPTFVGVYGRPTTMASAIAWFGEDSGPPVLDLLYRSGGVFNYFDDAVPLLRQRNPSYLSRHLPVWVEFELRRPLTTMSARDA